MEQMRSTWTDSRLDDLNGRVDDLNGRVDDLSRRVDHLAERMDAGFARVDGRIDSLQRTLIHAVIGIMAAMLTGFGGLAGLIATQL